MGNKLKTVIIIVLLVLLGLLGAYVLFGTNGLSSSQTSKAFFEDVIELQSTLSYYVGASYSDTFGVYTKTEILSGVSEDGEQITDNEGNILPELIYEDEVIEYSSKTAYMLNMDYVETTLGISIDDYEGIEFYVVDGDIIKVTFTDGTPDWWNSNYDSLAID